VKQHQKRGFNNVGENPVLKSLSGDPADQASTDSPACRNARWFFLSAAASHIASEPGVHALFDSAGAPGGGLSPFTKYWPNLIVRHRATQLAATIAGQDFLRYASVVPTDVLVGSEWLEWLAADPALAGLASIPAPTHMDVITTYIRKNTSVEGCNAHVTHRDLGVAILGKDRRLIQDASTAEVEYPVDVETVMSLLQWARLSWFRGEEAFGNPAGLDTADGVIQTLYLATKAEAQTKAASLSALPDRVSQQRGKTLARRGALSQHVFFSQATKVGLDYVRR